MAEPLLTVITVTYEDESGLARTLASLSGLRAQAEEGLEVIVQNGGSPRSMGTIRSRYPWLTVVSEKDSGIYDAMNRGVRRARGRFVWFLNGGDEAGDVNWSDLTAHLVRDDEFYAFDFIRVFEGKGELRRTRGGSYLRHALPTSHQAIIYPLSSPAFAYRTDLLAADYELTARLWRAGLTCVPVHLTLARFHAGGESTSRARQIGSDASLVQRDILGLGLGWRLRSRAVHAIARTAFRMKLSRARKASAESPWRSFCADYARYPSRAWLTQPAILAIAVYRFGTWTKVAPIVVRPFVHALYFSAYSLVRLATGIDIPRSVRIGPGLMIHHYGGVIINPHASIGARCTLRQGVVIGTRRHDTDVPRIGDGVEFGAHSQALGGIRIGDRAVVGAMTLVMSDVPPGATVVGIPGKVVTGG